MSRARHLARTRAMQRARRAARQAARRDAVWIAGMTKLFAPLVDACTRTVRDLSERLRFGGVAATDLASAVRRFGSRA